MAEQKIKALFTEKADAAIIDIVKNFGLEESYEELVKKEEQDKDPNELIISLLTKEFAQGSISEINLIASIQKDSGISKETAEKISKEIISKVVPLMEKIQEENESIPTTSKAKKDLHKKPPETILEGTIKDPFEPVKIKKPLPKKIIETKPKRTGPDTYREPIE